MHVELWAVSLIGHISSNSVFPVILTNITISRYCRVYWRNCIIISWERFKLGKKINSFFWQRGH